MLLEISRDLSISCVQWTRAQSGFLFQASGVRQGKIFLIWILDNIVFKQLGSVGTLVLVTFKHQRGISICKNLYKGFFLMGKGGGETAV